MYGTITDTVHWCEWTFPCTCRALLAGYDGHNRLWSASIDHRSSPLVHSYRILSARVTSHELFSFTRLEGESSVIRHTFWNFTLKLWELHWQQQTTDQILLNVVSEYLKHRPNFNTRVTEKTSLFHLVHNIILFGNDMSLFAHGTEVEIYADNTTTYVANLEYKLSKRIAWLLV